MEERKRQLLQEMKILPKESDIFQFVPYDSVRLKK